VLLCGHHHRLIHRNDWHVTIGNHGHPEFTPPPWIDPTQTPQQATWRTQLANLAPPSHAPPDTDAA